MGEKTTKEVKEINQEEEININQEEIDTDEVKQKNPQYYECSEDYQSF